MYRVPSRKKRKNSVKKPNIIPILDGVFIFLFFLLMTTAFVSIFEIHSNVPIVSDQFPPKSKRPLALTLRIYNNRIDIYKGLPSKYWRRVKKVDEGNYNFEKLRGHLISLKKKFPHENTIIFEPQENIIYEEIITIMDNVRFLKNTDDSIYLQNEEGMDVKINNLFNNIIFGNIQS